MSLDLLKSLLHDPRNTFWGSATGDAFDVHYGSAIRNLKPYAAYSLLFERFFLAQSLILESGVPPWFQGWAENRIRLAPHLPGLNWEMCRKGPWLAVPLLLSGRRIHVRWLVVGQVPGGGSEVFPPWVETVMDDKARRAVLDSITAAAAVSRPFEGMAIIGFPLVAEQESFRITGRSLGLSMGLACCLLNSGFKGCIEMPATGAVSTDGNVHPVGRVNEKAVHAKKKHFPAVMIPLTQRKDVILSGIETLPVETLKEAFLSASLYAPGQSKKLRMLETLLDDANAFLSNCISVPAHWLNWAKKAGRTAVVARKIRCSAEHLEAFLDTIMRCLMKGDISHAEAFFEIVRSASLESVEIPETDRSRFKWSLINLAFANHRGKVQNAQQWSENAESVIHDAPVSELSAFASFYNYQFVGLYHNHYRFDPEVPETLKNLLAALEAAHAAHLSLSQNFCNASLGALYGTIAQNFGFCGPKFLDRTRYFVNHALKAFGNDRSTRDDRRRQLYYLIHALLDAGRHTEAENTLFRYLEMGAGETLEDRLPKLDKWAHAAIARFVSGVSTDKTHQTYLSWVFERGISIAGKSHPWPLWLNNMGRCMLARGSKEQARAFFDESLKRCLSKRFGSTVRMMALMPLSGLFILGEISSSNLENTAERIFRAARALNPEYFHKLLNETDFQKTLNWVWHSPGLLFPFTYR